MFKYLGLEIEEDQIRILYAKWQWKKKQVKILANTCLHVPVTEGVRQYNGEAFLESELRAFLKQTKARPNGTGICIHPREVWRREIQMPIFMEKHIGIYLPTQVEGWAHEDRESYTFTGTRLMKEDKKLGKEESVPYCIMACQKERMLGSYQLLKNLNCNPRCVTTVMDTLPVSELLEAHPEHYVLILEKKSSWYVGFYQDIVCTFVQEVPKHSEQGIAFELSKLMSFYSVNHNRLQLEKIYFLWLVEKDEALENTLKEQLDIELMSIEPGKHKGYGAHDIGVVSLLQYMHKGRKYK